MFFLIRDQKRSGHEILKSVLVLLMGMVKASKNAWKVSKLQLVLASKSLVKTIEQVEFLCPGDVMCYSLLHWGTQRQNELAYTPTILTSSGRFLASSLCGRGAIHSWWITSLLTMSDLDTSPTPIINLSPEIKYKH